jgi:hypothetical protein
MFCSCEATRFVPSILSTTIQTHLIKKKCDCSSSVCNECIFYKFFINPENRGISREVNINSLKNFLVEVPQLNFEHDRFSLLYAYNDVGHCDESDNETEEYKVLKVNFRIFDFVTVINCGPTS